jgi:hypothetical protein
MAFASPLPPSVKRPAEARIAYVTGETGTTPTIHVIAADGSVDTSVAPGTLPSSSTGDPMKAHHRDVDVGGQGHGHTAFGAALGLCAPRLARGGTSP